METPCDTQSSLNSTRQEGVQRRAGSKISLRKKTAAAGEEWVLLDECGDRVYFSAGGNDTEKFMSEELPKFRKA